MMTIKIEIRGMRFFCNDDGTRAYRTLATAEVYIPELHMTIHDVRLAWSQDRGFVAHSPTAPRSTDRPLIQWFHKGEFCRDLSEKLRDMYERMGGKMPVELTAKERRVGAATRRIAEKMPQPVTVKKLRETYDVIESGDITLIGLPKREGHYKYERAAEPEACDLEAVAGLARTLSVEQQEAARVLG